MLRRSLLALALLGCVLCPPLRAQVPGLAGMTPLDGRRYLAARDLKTPRDKGPRLGILTFDQGIRYAPLPVASGWPDDQPGSDIEAICALPGAPGRFLAIESGYYKGRFGRLFLIALEARDGHLRPRVLSHARPFTAPAGGSTGSAAQIEGLACLPGADGARWLITAHRGSKRQAGWLAWRRLTLDADRLALAEQAGQAALPSAQALGCHRSAADLLLAPHPDGGWRALLCASADPGDNGPFRSLIYEPGRFLLAERTLRYEPRVTPRMHSVLDGLKVEALAPSPAKLRHQSHLAIGTDDEHYGGLWRPLGVRGLFPERAK